ncbi:MAG: hypothetical protein GWP05_03025 [Anaerolineaceae bacterium]|nr:hypothetical protein [Anaerolineaceae bacterium]
MASTYTTRLNLEKPANNDQVDTWDQVVNANMDLLDAAMFTVGVRTDDPATPSEGELWLRSDLTELRARIGSTTYKVALTAV